MNSDLFGDSELENEMRDLRDERQESNDLVDKVIHWKTRALEAEATVQKMQNLFANGPDTSCRTTWHDGIMYVEVQMEELQQALH